MKPTTLWRIKIRSILLNLSQYSLSHGRKTCKTLQNWRQELIRKLNQGGWTLLWGVIFPLDRINISIGSRYRTINAKMLIFKFNDVLWYLLNYLHRSVRITNRKLMCTHTQIKPSGMVQIIRSNWLVRLKNQWFS